MKITINIMPIKQGPAFKKFLGCLKVPNVLGIIPLIDARELPPEQAPQRPQSRAHARKIANFFRANPDRAHLPPITICVSKANVKLFQGQNFGTLTIDEGAEIYVLDGQHRIISFKICERDGDLYLFEDWSLALEIYVGLSLADRQQIFIDLNSGKRVSKVWDLNLSQRPEAKLARRIAAEVSGFAGFIEKSHGTVSKNSPYLFTTLQVLHSYSHIAQGLIERSENGTIDPKMENRIIRAYEIISTSIKPYQLIRDGDLSARETYIVSDPFILKVLFNVVFHLRQEGRISDATIGEGLMEIDWRRYHGNHLNPLWERFMRPLPEATIVRLKNNQNEIMRIVTEEIERQK